MICLLTILVVFGASFVLANTEIRNFHVGDTAEHPRNGHSPPYAYTHSLAQAHGLNASHNEYSFRVQPAPLGTPLHLVCELDKQRCPHELWLRLDLASAEWKRYDSFTLRLSWPAFYPTDFDIAIFSSDELNNYTQLPPEREHPYEDHSPSRMKYARVRLVDTGVRPPSKSTTIFPSLYRGNQANDEDGTVPFTIILEPLLFGVLPASLVPTILFSIPLLIAVGFAYPYVMRYLEGVAEKARKELYDLGRLKQE